MILGINKTQCVTIAIFLSSSYIRAIGAKCRISFRDWETSAGSALRLINLEDSWNRDGLIALNKSHAKCFLRNADCQADRKLNNCSNNIAAYIKQSSYFTLPLSLRLVLAAWSSKVNLTQNFIAVKLAAIVSHLTPSVTFWVTCLPWLITAHRSYRGSFNYTISNSAARNRKSISQLLAWMYVEITIN